jgi:hypothetical protein
VTLRTCRECQTPYDFSESEDGLHDCAYADAKRLVAAVAERDELRAKVAMLEARLKERAGRVRYVEARSLDYVMELVAKCSALSVAKTGRDAARSALYQCKGALDAAETLLRQGGVIPIKGESWRQVRAALNTVQEVLGE